jgi:hypothetical protein
VPLCVAIQDGKLCLWASVDPERNPSTIRIFIVGTGHPIPADANNYVGTVQDRMFIWHVYTE